MRPTETPAPGLAPLKDDEIADWLEARPHAALWFWDETDPVSQKQRARMEIMAASASIPIGVLDIRTDALVAQALGVTSVPALVVFRQGDVVERVMGSAPDAILREAILGPTPHRAK